MMPSLYTAASGMLGQQMNVDVTANNLANVNTMGFKKSRLDFQDLLYQTLRQPGTPGRGDTQLPTGLQVGVGVRSGSVQKIHLQGSPQETGNVLDLAIFGDGFFQILQDDGTIAYTRDGAFKVDSNGRVVTSDGFFLEPEIVVPQDATNLSISPGGTVTVEVAGETQEVGQIQVARFINPAGLRSIGKNLYKQTAASGNPIVDNPGVNNLGEVQQGFLERSNVQVVEEMVNLIIANRAYDANSRAITTADQMLTTASQLKR